MNLFLRIPAYIFVNKLFLLDSKFVPILGCINPYPSITIFLFSSKIGSFKMCAIEPINCRPVSRDRLVSESRVITYLIFVFGSPWGATPTEFVIDSLFCRLPICRGHNCVYSKWIVSINKKIIKFTK